LRGPAAHPLFRRPRSGGRALSKFPNFADTAFTEGDEAKPPPDGPVWETPEGISVKAAYDDHDIEGAGHLAHYEFPDRVNPLLIRFLTQ